MRVNTTMSSSKAQRPKACSRYTYPTLLLLLLLGVSFLPACRKSALDDTEVAEHTAEFAFPLFSTTLYLEDLMFKVLNDTLSGDTLLVNPDQTMTLIYTGDVARKPATDIFSDLVGGAGAPPLPVLDTLYKAPFDAPPGVTLRQANLSSGTIQLGIANATGQVVTGKFQVVQMTKNGQVFTIPFTALPGFPFVSQKIPVKDYILKSDSNTFEFRYEAYLPNGQRVKLPDFNGLPPMLVYFENIQFSYMEGYWAKQVYSLIRDTIEIDINQTDLDGSVTIKNPRVTFRVQNSWGFPTRGQLKYLSFIGQNGQELELESTVFQQDSFRYIDFAYPSWSAGEIGQTKSVQVTLDESNSNIADIFNSQPVQLIYEIDGIANAQGDSSVIGFITDSSDITLGVRVELLLEGSARNFRADQTLDLNFGQYADIDTANIESVEFKLVTENRTPISAELQILFLDENDVVVDSLFTGGPRFIMNAAPVDANGVTNGVQRTENFIPMDVPRFNRVRNAKRAALYSAFTTAQDGNTLVKLLATDQAEVKMGLKVKTKF